MTALTSVPVLAEHPGRSSRLVAAEVLFDLLFDLLQVFSLGGLIVGQLRPTASELTHGVQLASAALEETARLSP